MSLYLKYRPQDFGSVVGQTHVVQTLSNTLKQNQLSHAYLFCGPRGTGKTSLARIVAKSLNCTQRPIDSAEPCHECQICQDTIQGRLVDLIEIDAASNRGIDEIRDLREKIVFTPTQAKAKVYIIDEVHMLTKEAFNALLKTLEEPPEHAYFILATTEAHKIPETIVSRCQQFAFKRIENQDIVNRLHFICQQEKFDAEEEALQLIAKAAHGGLRDAIGLLEQMAASGAMDYQSASLQLGVSGKVVMEKFAQALSQQNPLGAIELLNQIHAQGKSLSAFLEEWIAYLRDQMLASLDAPEKVRESMEWIDLFTTAKQQLSQAILPQLPLEMAIVRACQFKVKEGEESSIKTESTHPSSKKSVVATLPVPPTVQNKIQEGQPLPENTELASTIAAIFIENASVESPSLDAAPTIGAQNVEPLQKVEPLQELTLLLIQEKWQDLLSAIATPFIKMSLKDGKPVKWEENTLHLEFNSSTLMEKIENSSNQLVLIQAFEEIFQAKPMLKFAVRNIMLSPLLPTAEEGSGDGQKGAPSAVELAQEVFGIGNSGQQ